MKISVAHFLAIAGAAAGDVTISAPSSVPSLASAPVDESFLGIMVETTSWWRYGSEPASLALIKNLVDRTNAPVIIRVGGTSGDEASYNPNLNGGNSWPYGNDGLLAPVTLGKAFTDGLARVPGVRYILEVPLANSSVEDTVKFTKAVLQRFDASKLEAIEVGNEPNLYAGQQWRGDYKRSKSYTPQDYVEQLKKYTDAIVEGIPGLPAGPIFHVGSLSDGSTWTAEDLYKAGLGGVTRIKALAQHYYQSSIRFNPTMEDTYLDHAGSVVKKTDGNPQKNLDYMRAAKIDTPIIISEAGSALGGTSDFERQIDAVLGSALWEVDWALLAMSKGIHRVNMNQCNGCNFASWWANGGAGGEAEVFSQYYGLMFLADWLGADAECRGDAPFRVASLYDEAKHPHVSPYAGFVDGKLDRLAVLDLNPWNMTERTTRMERTFEISVGTDVKAAELRRLTGKGTDAMAADGGITYAGTQWTTSAPAGKKVGDETEKVTVSKGKLSFKLKASEAVLVTVHR